MPFSLACWPPVYTAVALQAAAQVPVGLPPPEELEALEELEELEDPDPPPSGPMYCQRLAVVGFQPVEL